MPTADPPEDLPDRIRDALRDADDPLSTGAVQRRVARGGLDVTRRVVADACAGMAEEGRLVAVGDAPTRYRLPDGGGGDRDGADGDGDGADSDGDGVA